MTIVFTDSHCEYYELKPEVKFLIGEAKRNNERLIGVGDLLNLLPWGVDKWIGCQCVGELIEELDGYDFDYVAGNHDPPSYLKKLFKDYPNVHIHKRLDVDGFHFRHGHGWAIDWRFLRHFAPQFVEFMADHFPRAWYWFSRRMGWLPSKKKEKAKLGGYIEEQKYDDATGILWRNAIKYAQHRGVCVIVGHTHAAAELRRPVIVRVGYTQKHPGYPRPIVSKIKAVMLDGGDTDDRTHITIRDGEAHIEYLKVRGAGQQNK